MSNPWKYKSGKAVYALQSLVEYFDKKQKFASKQVQRRFECVSTFSYSLPLSGLNEPVLDILTSDWLSAVLAKIAQRGVPAPCSLDLERFTLNQAQYAGILKFQEINQSGEYQFTLSPTDEYRQDFHRFLNVAFYPELLVDDNEVDIILERYTAEPLSTTLEKELFERLLSRFNDRRLGLFVIPQRRVEHILATAPGNPERPDFTVDIHALASSSSIRIVLEADDLLHQEAAQVKIDQEKDRRFKMADFRVERFQTWERDTWDVRLDQIAEEIRNIISDDLIASAKKLRELPKSIFTAFTDLVNLPVLEAQLLVLLSQTVRQSRTTRLLIAETNTNPLNLSPVIDAVNGTLTALCSLASIESPDRVTLCDCDSQSGLVISHSPSIHIWEAVDFEKPFQCPAPLRFDYIPPLLSAKPRMLAVNIEHVDSKKALELLLGNIFRKVEFREGQLPIIARALSLKPVVGLLPTGAGKSLCYQLASFLQPGFTLVIDPLRSLMIDQCDNLRNIGVHRAASIMSGNDESPQAVKNIAEGLYGFVFISPERLQRISFLTKLTQAIFSFPVTYCVIDEAHCVSEWGHDFRTAYLNVGRRVREYCVHDGSEPRLIALTGTASRNVLIDVMKELKIDDQTAIIEPKSFDRPELEFQVTRVKNYDRLANLTGQLKALLSDESSDREKCGGLVFTYFQSYVSVSVEQIIKHLQNNISSVTVRAYSGSDEEKNSVQKQFKNDEVPLLVCTHGFGMGIDKPNIRYVIHAMLPRSIEDYYQQAGRAGRDRAPAKCFIFFSDENDRFANELLNTELTPPENLKNMITNVSESTRSDLVRNLWFITQAFPDRKQEKESLWYVINILNFQDEEAESEITRSVTPEFLENMLPEKNESPNRKDVYAKYLEKALYRLSILGVVIDYKVEGSIQSPKYQVDIKVLRPEDVKEQLRGYLNHYLIEADISKFLPNNLGPDLHNAIYQCGQKLIEFMYHAVEKRRRAALGNMLRIARVGADLGAVEFRRELLAFLEESEFTDPVKQISTKLQPDGWFDVLEQIKGVDDITKLLGASRRQLQETPEHPGLHLLLGVCYLNGPYPDESEKWLSLAFRGLVERIDPDERVIIAKRLHSYVNNRYNSMHNSMALNSILESDPSRAMTEYCYTQTVPYSKAHHTAIRVIATRILKTIKQ